MTDVVTSIMHDDGTQAGGIQLLRGPVKRPERMMQKLVRTYRRDVQVRLLSRYLAYLPSLCLSSDTAKSVRMVLMWVQVVAPRACRTLLLLSGPCVLCSRLQI
jgi:hypothetical protein